MSSSPAHMRPLLVSADDWSVLVRACHADPPSSRALVTRIRWFLARPAASAAGLALLAGLRWFCACCRSRSVLERACQSDPLVLGSSAASLLVLLRRLVSAGPALVEALSLFLSVLVKGTRWFLARPAASLLVSAGSVLVAALGPFLSALVTRTSWFLARPAASLLVLLCRLVSAGLALVAALGPFLSALVMQTRWFLARPAASLLVLLR